MSSNVYIYIEDLLHMQRTYIQFKSTIIVVLNYCNANVLYSLASPFNFL